MSEAIHKLLDSSRQKYLSTSNIIIIASLIDIVQTHNTRMTWPEEFEKILILV